MVYSTALNTMFSDSSVESTNFVVAAESKRDEDDAYCQTAALVRNEKETQTELSKDFSCQAETAGLNYTPSYDVDKLASFLRKIYPDLVEELEKFDSTPPVMKQYHSSSEEGTPVNLHNIDLKDIEEKVVSSLSFSSDGKSLAVAFCMQNHESWCTHSSEIHAYKTSADDYSTFPVKHILKTNSCVNQISFHPSLPSHLACGLYNGQVFVWSLVAEYLEQTFDDVHSSDAKHSDAVTSLSWLPNRELFMSSGRDGVIIFWNYNMMRLAANSSYFISSKYINTDKTVNDHAEILCFGMWKVRESTQFIIGTEGGNILHCSYSKTEVSEIPQKAGFLDPVIMKYEPHDGIITCVACSGKDVFATCGTNSEIRVYKAKEKVPIHVIYTNFPVLGIEWFEGSSVIIACWGYGPILHFNNIRTKDWLKSHAINLRNPDSSITAVAVSQTRSSVIAVGADKGEVGIWMLPDLTFINILASVSVQK